MIFLGVILLVIGLLAAIPALFWIGLVLALLGAFANFAPGPWGGRRYW